MSKIFLSILSAMIVFTQYIIFRDSQKNGITTKEKKVLTWATGMNRSKQGTLDLFQAWLKRNGNLQIAIKPEVGISSQKIITQGVAGVCPDLFDSGSSQITFYKKIGILADLTQVIEDMGLGISNFYGPTRGDFYSEGKFFAFPNITQIRLFLVNRTQFKKVGLPEPKQRMSFEEFEEFGRKYVALANRGLARRSYFFADSAPRELMLRSVGISYLNETLTAPDFTPNDERFIRVLELIKKWTEVDHLFPSESEMVSFNTEQGGLASQGGFGAEPEIFYRGHFALLNGFRSALLIIRDLGSPIEIGCMEPPNGGFPNTLAISVSFGAYARNPDPQLLKTFFEFVRSEDYNLKLISDCDDLPPNPEFHHHPELIHPSAHRNEWALHEGISRLADEIAFGRIHSPFIVFSHIQREEKKPIQNFLNGKLSAPSAVSEIHRLIKAEIARQVKADPELRVAFQEKIVRQNEIESFKSAGKSIPLEIIDNQFLKIYYASKK